MPRLAELQADVRRAITLDEPASLRGRLAGGRNPLARLAIHRRHYQTSLVTALLEKFPATGWLIGTDTVKTAASAFVQAYPPDRPSIAEYGSGFPAFLAARGTRATRAYLRPFAELEWAVGQVAMAITEPPIGWTQLVAVGAGALPETVLRFQTGLRYLRADCAVDELMKLYLADAAPDRFVLEEGDVRIQVRGARGDIHFGRLEPAAFVFRSALLAGLSLGDAAECALARDQRFDPAQALANLVADGLVTTLETPTGAMP